MLSAPSQFGAGMPKDGQFWAVFWPAGSFVPVVRLVWQFPFAGTAQGAPATLPPSLTYIHCRFAFVTVPACH
jgi:hypothetical protein